MCRCSVASLRISLTVAAASVSTHTSALLPDTVTAMLVTKSAGSGTDTELRKDYTHITHIQIPSLLLSLHIHAD